MVEPNLPPHHAQRLLHQPARRLPLANPPGSISSRSKSKTQPPRNPAFLPWWTKPNPSLPTRQRPLPPFLRRNHRGGLEFQAPYVLNVNPPSSNRPRPWRGAESAPNARRSRTMHGCYSSMRQPREDPLFVHVTADNACAVTKDQDDQFNRSCRLPSASRFSLKSSSSQSATSNGRTSSPRRDLPISFGSVPLARSAARRSTSRV